MKDFVDNNMYFPECFKIDLLIHVSEIVTTRIELTAKQLKH